MVSRNLDIPMDRIEAFCRKWKIREFSLFGSVLRDDFRPDSDVDVLVSFEPDAPWDLFHLVEMRDELIALFGRDVDLVEKEGLRNPFRRRTILDTREVIYGTRDAPAHTGPGMGIRNTTFLCRRADFS